MKKKSILWLLLMALMALPTVSMAQDTLTVANGTTNSGYYPFYGFWADYNQHSQMVYPASMLGGLAGNAISKLTFYATNSTSYLSSGTFVVSIGTISSFTPFTSSQSSLITGADLTEVFSGTLSLGTDNVLDVEFSNAFEYSDGDLLIDVVYTPVGSSYGYMYFYGANQSDNRSLNAYGSSNAYASGFLPKCTFEYESSDPNACRKVKDLAVVPATNTLTLSWLDTLNSGATYTLMVAHGTDTQTYAGISGTSYTFTGLDANTAYTLGVKSVCSADNESKYATIAARTDCEELTIPWLDGFESYDANTFPDCWTRISGSEGGYYTTTTYPYIYNQGLFGNRMLYMYVYNSGDTNFVRTQMLPIEANNMHISFWLSTSGKMEVGLLTDPTDLGTFTVLRTITSNGGYLQYDIYTDTVADLDATTGVYLAFRLANSYAYLDEVSVSEVSDCRRPVGAVTEEVTYNSAYHHWTVDEASIATTYDVLLTTGVHTDADTTGSILFPAVNDTAVELIGLEPHTQYYIWVRGVCDDDNVSAWGYTGGFETDYSCYALENFAVNSVNYTSASIGWDYAGNGRGLEELGVHFTLRDSSGAIIREWDMDKEDGTQTFITGLNPASSYLLTARTLCDPDTASGIQSSFSTSSCGEVTSVASGSNYTNYSYYYPMYSYYSSSSSYPYVSASQILYPASVVSGMSSIDGISLHLHSASYDADITADVYLAYTDKTEFSTSSDVMDTTLFTCVARNAQFHTGTTSGWVDIDFDTPFATGGNGQNIAVMLYTKSIASTSTYPYIYWDYHYNSSTQGYVTLYSYGYASTYNNAAAVLGNYNHSRVQNRPHIRFIGNCELDCLAPNLAVSGVDINSADLRWARGLDEGSWALQYRLDSVATWTNAPAPADTTATISGLSAKSLYRFRVGAVCGDGDTLWSNTADAWTDCEPLESLPFTEGFESIPTNRDPLCWTVVDYRTSSYSRHYVQSSTKHNGQQAMNVYPYGVTYVVSPKLPAGTNPAELEINYWAYLDNSGQRYEVGYMTDPQDTNTFRTLYTCGGNGSSWVEYTVYGDTTTLTAADDIYVAWRYYVDNGYNCYLDDVSINVATCKRPNNLQIEALNYESVTIGWTAMEDVTYEYCITTANTAAAIDTAAKQTTSELSATIDELNANTTYYFWVRTICEGNDITPWSATFSFTTPCTPEPMPWIENFNSMSSFSSCWTRYTGAWTPTPNYQPSTSGWSLESSYGGIHIDGKAPAFNLYSTNKYWLITPMISITSTAVFSMDLAGEKWSSDGNYFDDDDRVVIAVSTNGGSTWTPIYQLGASATDDMPLTDLTVDYTNINVPLIGYEGQNIRIAVYGGSTYYGGDSRIVIDNIAVMSAGCMRPSNVQIVRDAEEATFSWTDISTENEAGYELVINTANSLTGDNARTFQIPVTDSTFTVGELTPATTYYYFLRSACDETPTASSWATGSFRTICLPLTLPLDDDFESSLAGTGSFPDCWERVKAVTSYSSVYPYTYNYGGVHGNTLYMYGYNSSDYSGDTAGIVAATPFIPAPLNGLEISLDVYSSSYYTPIKMYVGTNPYNASTWEYVMTLPNNGQWQTIELTTDELTTTDSGYVIFTGASGYSSYCSGYLDNVYITVANSCRRPASITANASEITAYTVGLTWPEVDGAEAYRVKYSTVNDIATADSIADVYDNSAVVEGLQNGTQYYFWVQTVCADGISDPRGTTATTAISCYPITNLHRTGSNPTAVAYMWDIDPRGNEAVGVVVTLKDLTAGTETTQPAMGMGYHIFDNLVEGHSYEATFRTVCDVDSAAGVTVSFAPSSASALGEACAAIGVNTSTISEVPLYDRDRYSLTQMVYPLTSVGSDVTQLTGIAFYSTVGDTHNIKLDVYIGQTSQSSVTSSTPISIASQTMVVSDYSFVAEDSGWVEIPFDMPYTLSSTGNIVITVDNNTGHYTTYDERKQWAYSTATAGSAIYLHSDNTDYNPSNLSSYSFITASGVPDIKFYGDCNEVVANDCYRPVAVVSDIDSTSVSVMWNGNSSSYTVQYKMAADTAWTTATTAATSPATVTGLQPGTIYQVRVVGLCEGDEYNGSSIRFSTDCAPLHIPFHFTQADMQAVSVPGFSPCWDWESFYRNSTSGTYYVNSSSNSGWFALPEIAEPLSGTQLRTQVAATSSGSSMRVGVMDEDGSITWLETRGLLQAASVSAATEQVFYLDSYTGTGKRVVVGSVGGNNVYFLDFHVEAIESCRHIGELVVEDFSESSASISWTGATGQTQWAVYLNGVLQGTTTTASYNLTGLSSSTSYTVSVRAVCGAGDTSSAVSATLRTLCGNVTSFPWYEDFEGGIECWSTYSYDGISSDDWDLSSSTSHNGSHAAVTSYNSSANANDWLVSPALVLPAGATDIQLSWAASGSSFQYYYPHYRVMIGTEASDTSTFTELFESTISTSSTWYLDSVDIASTYAGQTVYIAFVHDDYNSNGVYIDDVRLTLVGGVNPGPGPGPGPAPECEAPVAGNVSTSSNSATFSWTGNASSYEVAIAPGADFSNPNVEAVVTPLGSNMTYTFEDLEPSTTYTVGVRAICEDGVRSAWATRQATTTAVGIDAVDVLGLTLYPNPASSMVTIEADNAVDAQVSIIDQSGRVAGTWQMEGSSLSIDLSGMARGAYYVRLTTAETTAVRKLIVQ